MPTILNNYGWVPDSDGLDAFVYGQSARRGGVLITGAGIEQAVALDLRQLRAADDNGDVFPWRMLRAVLPDSFFKVDSRVAVERMLSLDQGSVGSCVGVAEAVVLRYTIVGDFARDGQAEQWTDADPAGDALYSLSRDVSGQLGGSDGSTNAWMLQAITKVGVPLRRVYGSHDLRQYSAARARDWAKRGVPQAIKTAAAEHKVLASVRLRNIEDAWTYLGTWGAINCCSMWGGTGNRLKDGIMRRSGTWAHSMAMAGRCTIGGRRYVCLHQSWGNNWAEGGAASTIHPHDLPWGAFWISLDDDVSWILSRGGGELVAPVDFNGVPSAPDFIFG